MLRGQKVLLRPVRRSDIEYFLKWFNDMDVTQYLNLYLPMTEMGEEQWIDNLGARRNSAMFVIEAIDGASNKPIGSTGLEDISARDHNATFGIAVGDKDYWSKGYGTEAARLLIAYGFEQLNLHRINSFAFAFNERSIRMHKAIGFKQEGLRRELIFKNGKFQDDVIFGLLRTEWKGL